LEEAAGVADGAELWGWKIVELDNEIICRGFGLRVAGVKLLNVLVETLEAYI
jgi:hypothetical protein